VLLEPLGYDIKMKCICGNDLSYEKCCGKFIEGFAKPTTAVELMRSRYSAYALKEGQYLYDTCSNRLKNTDDIATIVTSTTQWLGLKVHSFSQNEVTFSAYYTENKKIEVLKEHSFFIEEEGWKYDWGEMLDVKIERNETCPCGSGKKYKKCCVKWQ